MGNRKTYAFRWSATGSIEVRGDSPGDARDNAEHAIRSLITAEAGRVNVHDSVLDADYKELQQ